MEFEQFEAGLTMIAGEDLLKLIAQRDAHREKVAALEATVAYLLMRDLPNPDGEATAKQIKTLTEAIAKHPLTKQREQELRAIDQLMWNSKTSEEFRAAPIPNVGQRQEGDRPPTN